MMNMKKMIVLVIALFLFFSFGCFDIERPIEDINKYTEMQNGHSIYFEEVCSEMHGIWSDDTKKKAYVITNKNDLIALYRSCDVNISFENYTVIGASLGYKSGSGYGIEITKVVETNAKIFAIIKSSQPPPGYLGGATTSHPLKLYKIKKTNNEIIFVE